MHDDSIGTISSDRCSETWFNNNLSSWSQEPSYSPDDIGSCVVRVLRFPYLRNIQPCARTRPAHYRSLPPAIAVPLHPKTSLVIHYHTPTSMPSSTDCFPDWVLCHEVNLAFYRQFESDRTWNYLVCYKTKGTTKGSRHAASTH